jgi:glycosyltransferase involved in cell wall biosynthesis
VESLSVALVIPAYNEAVNLPTVLQAVPRHLVSRVIVVDNASTDDTADVAARHGATVIRETRRGYGWACWAGASAAWNTYDVIALLDADFSENPAELGALLEPLESNRADFVLGTRARLAQAGALLPHQRFGNTLTAVLMYLLYGARVTDLAPFRAIRSSLLRSLEMQERTFGWSVEMMVKAARARARMVEVDVQCRPRFAGQSKVSGTVKGSVKAGIVILRTTLRYAAWRPTS